MARCSPVNTKWHMQKSIHLRPTFLPKESLWRVQVTLTKFWLPQLHSFCVCVTHEVQEVLIIWISVVDLFLLNQFRKLINQHFWWGFLFWSYTSNHNYVYTENGSKNRSRQIGDFNIPQKLFQCMQSRCKSQVPCFLTSHVHPQTTCWTKARPRHFLYETTFCKQYPHFWYTWSGICESCQHKGRFTTRR